MKYSIKTTDGNRYDFEEENNLPVYEILNSSRKTVTIKAADGSTRYFMKHNIVCITEKEST